GTHLPHPVRSGFEDGRRVARHRSAVDVRAAAGRRRRRRRCRGARVEQRRDEGVAGEFAAVRSNCRVKSVSGGVTRSATQVPNYSAYSLQLVPGPPDGRAGFGFSSANVLGSLRYRLSECGCFVSGKADGSFVAVLVGPAHPTALMPISNTTAAVPV